MFVSVRRTYVLFTLLSTLLFIGITPLVVRAEVDTNTTQTTEIRGEATTSTDASQFSPAIASLLNLYPIEGVPGGDAVVGDFVVGPGKVDITVLPGETKVVEVLVTNRTGEERQFNVTIEDAEGSRDVNTTLVLLGDDRGPYSLKDYVSVPHKSFILGHNERARIPVTISLPQNAEPGGLYGSVLIDTVAIDAKPGDSAGAAPQSAIIARIGTLFFVTVPGDVEKNGSLSHFGTVPEKIFFQGSPINFGILFENEGTMHLAPYGELRITNIFDEEVGYVEIDPWFVFPQSIRLREIVWDRDFLFGRYTATVFINRSYDDTIDTQSFSFWVLPLKVMLAGFGGMFIFIFIVRLFFRSFEFKRK
ncbi:MAG: DUF916 domain-containing protein [Minisyncoccia bacterium]